MNSSGMNELTLAVLIFVAFTSVVSVFMVLRLQKAKTEGLTGVDLLKRLAPFILADGAFTLLFVAWFVTNQ